MSESKPESRHPLAAESELRTGVLVTELLAEDAASLRYLVTEGGEVCEARVFTSAWCLKVEVREQIAAAARAQARVAHANVRAIRDVFETDAGELVVLAERVDGPSASAFLDARGSLAEAEAVDVVSQVLSGLAACHRRGLLHLGLRPECVLLERDATDALRVVVDGFGLGHALPAAETHWSPEQRAGEAGDERADVYAVGLLLHELLTGEANAAPETLERLRTELPTLSLTAEKVLVRALARDPGTRFKTAGSMRLALGSDASILPSMENITSSGPRSQRILTTQESRAVRTRNLRTVGVVAVIAGVLALAGLGWTLLRGPIEDAADKTIDADDGDRGSLVRGSTRVRAPEFTAENPLPVEALPHVGRAPALVEVLFVLDLDAPYRSPLLLGDSVDALTTRYGENLRISFVLHTEAGDGDLRARAALAGQLQNAFLPLASALALAADIDSVEAAAGVGSGLDSDLLAVDIESEGVDSLLAYHAEFVDRLDASPGDVYVNGARLRYGASETRVPTLPVITAAIDAELDGVQAALTDGTTPESVARVRTLRNRAAVRDDEARDERGPLDAPRVAAELDGLPALGASNAPLALVVYLDPGNEASAALLEQANGFYLRNPDFVRLLVKVAPAPASVDGFDRAMRLLSAHADGVFWQALDDGSHAVSDPEAAQLDLLRTRLIDHARDALTIQPGGEPFLLANGRIVSGSAGTVDRALEEERLVVEQLVAGGVPREQVYALVSAGAAAVAPQPPPQPARFLVANWQALPHVGALESPVIVFWRLGIDVDLAEPDAQLPPSFVRTVRALLELDAAHGGEVTLVFAPRLGGVERPSEATETFFLSLWNQPADTVRDRLRALVSGAEPPTVAAFLAWHEANPLQIAADALESPRSTPEPDEERSDDEDVIEVDPAAEAAARAVRRQAVVDAVRASIESHARQWSAEEALHSGLVFAWRSGLSLVGWSSREGLAFEWYWDVARRALANQR